MWATVCFGAAAFFMLLCFFLLGAIMVAPAKFTTCFSLACVSAIAGLAFLSGPRVYIKKLFVAENRYASALLIASFIFGLYFSMIVESYLLSVLFCILQLNAIMYFFCKTSAVNTTTLKWFFKSLWTSITMLFTSGA